MGRDAQSSDFQRAIDTVEMLPVDDQLLLLEIIRQRLIEHRRAGIGEMVAEARAAYKAGNMRRGTVDELMADLEEEAGCAPRSDKQASSRVLRSTA